MISAIRRALAEGDFDAAVRWSGHPMPLAGRVRRGRELGRAFGFPTANLPYPPDKVPMAHGVYAGWALHEEKWHPAVANLGLAPTVSDAGELRLEVHFLDGAPELYGQELSVALATRLRAERKFDSQDELKAAIAADCARARTWLAGAPEHARPGRLERLAGIGPA